ncbi:MAG: hypothetical protein E6J14_02995 [Chloroflexi bacterium]|nr:MAG: hypothetical protein E6J14_02995 [Chloroflexota bacterium]
MSRWWSALGGGRGVALLSAGAAALIAWTSGVMPGWVASGTLLGVAAGLARLGLIPADLYAPLLPRARRRAGRGQAPSGDTARLQSRGLALLRSGDMTAAEDALRAAEEQARAAGQLDPAIACAYNRGVVLALSGRGQEAAAVWTATRREAAANHATRWLPWLDAGLAAAALESGDAVEAGTLLGRSVQSLGGRAPSGLAGELVLLSARINVLAGHADAARQQLAVEVKRRRRQRSPDSVAEALAWLALAELAAGDEQAAASSAAAAAASAPASNGHRSLGRLETARGGMRERRGDHAVAAAHYHAALEHYQFCKDDAACASLRARLAALLPAGDGAGELLEAV